MSLIRMKILRLMRVNTLKDRIKNWKFKGKLDIPLIKDKMRVTCLIWSSHEKRGPKDATVRKIIVGGYRHFK